MAGARKNLAYAIVATAPSPAASGTSLVVTTGHGTRFPAAPFNATVWPVNATPTPTTAEIVRVTAVSTDTLTITRTQESTSARTILVGDQIAATITAKTLSDMTDVVSAADFGTVGDGVTDDTAEIQAAIDYALEFGYPIVRLPRGVFKTSDTLHLGYGHNAFATVVLEGPTGYDAGGTSRCVIRPTFVDRPVINIQGGRQSGVRRVGIWGTTPMANANPWATSLTAVADLANYIPAGAATAPRSPFCGVCIDAYGGNVPPSPYPTPTYPAFLGTVSSAYNKFTSSSPFVQECHILDTLIGVCCQPNTDSNGDFLSLRGTRFGNLQVAISIVNVNARSTNYSDTNFALCHTLIDGVTYKTDEFSNRGNFAGNLSNMCGNLIYQIFNIDRDWAVSTVMTNFYAEGMLTIGDCRGGVGLLTFVGCMFPFNQWSGTQQFSVPAYHGIRTKFIGCTFKSFRAGLVFDGDVQFDHCQFNPLTQEFTATPDAHEQLATWDAFGGVFLPYPRLRRTMSPRIQQSCVTAADGVKKDYDAGDDDTVRNYHSVAMDLQGRFCYVVPSWVRAGGGSASLLSSRVTTARGFTASGPEYFGWTVGDVIQIDDTASWFVVAVVGTPSGGQVPLTFHALTYFAATGATYSLLAGIELAGQEITYFPYRVFDVPVDQNLRLSVTSGSPTVNVLDLAGALATRPSSIAVGSKVLWHGNNALLITTDVPFPANTLVTAVFAQSFTMGADATLTGEFCMAPGIARVS